MTTRWSKQASISSVGVVTALAAAVFLPPYWDRLVLSALQYSQPDLGHLSGTGLGSALSAIGGVIVYTALFLSCFRYIRHIHAWKLTRLNTRTPATHGPSFASDLWTSFLVSGIPFGLGMTVVPILPREAVLPGLPFVRLWAVVLITLAILAFLIAFRHGLKIIRSLDGASE